MTIANSQVDGKNHSKNGRRSLNSNLYDGKEYIWLNGGPGADYLKSRDGWVFFAVLAPGTQPNPNDLGIKTILNGQIVQDWNTNDMIFDVPTLIEFLSGSTTLLPGTVILTGTPHGVGLGQKPPRWLQHGDTVTIEIEKIGSLTNPVCNETV